ncbi:hypothetical protein E4U43_001075 [Claviceps pusilla]|uniref:Uncharacterized protein n=1 Tax=Claviceps pusilla TaxID=123648 RepID=A0A9P7NIK6_9HYPO|nr:hypothetical protein E4U43_001075 [Claviceps pusilla]
MQFLSVLILSLSGLAMANPVPDNAAKPEAAAVKPNVITPMGPCVIFDDCDRRGCCLHLRK